MHSLLKGQISPSSNRPSLRGFAMADSLNQLRQFEAKGEKKYSISRRNPCKEKQQLHGQSGACLDDLHFDKSTCGLPRVNAKTQFWFTAILLSFIAGLIFTACMDIRSYPEVPEVKFKEFRYKDSTLVISFVDGDGDFGIPAGYLDPPFDTGSTYYFNVFFTFEQKVDTGYVRVPMADYSYWNLRVEDVPQPQGQNKTMFGDIELRLLPILGPNYLYPDTFRFTFYLYDFALHKSNTGVTPPLSFKNIK